jgi:CheY-like chemotaxis protein
MNKEVSMNDLLNVAIDSDNRPVMISENLACLKFLIVDDCADNIALAKIFLQKMGADINNIHTAQGGDEATRLSKQNNYDIIIMDVFMPEVDGFEATKSIKGGHSKTSRPLVIGHSGGVTATNIVNCLRVGMISFMPKPLNMSQFSTVVNRVMSLF